ncbi:hypothetical protein FA15DRAFT_584979, partial [Coprinopsis marcescibilis]
SLKDKVKGATEKLKGKIQQDPEKAQCDQVNASGTESHRDTPQIEGISEVSSIPDVILGNSEEHRRALSHSGGKALHLHDDKGHHEIASTVAPAGTEKCEDERTGGATDRMKYI